MGDTFQLLKGEQKHKNIEVGHYYKTLGGDVVRAMSMFEIVNSKNNKVVIFTVKGKGTAYNVDTTGRFYVDNTEVRSSIYDIEHEVKASAKNLLTFYAICGTIVLAGIIYSIFGV